MLGRVKAIRAQGAIAFVAVTSSASFASAMGVAPVKLRLEVLTNPDQPDQPVEAKDLKKFVKKVQRGDWVGEYHLSISRPAD